MCLFLLFSVFCDNINNNNEEFIGSSIVIGNSCTKLDGTFIVSIAVL